MNKKVIKSTDLTVTSALLRLYVHSADIIFIADD